MRHLSGIDPVRALNDLALRSPAEYLGEPCDRHDAARDALLDLRHAPLHLGARKVLIPVIDRLEFAAINRDAGLREHEPERTEI
jgi:hypothetical protein